MRLIYVVLLATMAARAQDGQIELYEDNAQHFATDADSECQYDGTTPATDETGQIDYQNHRRLLIRTQVPTRRKRPTNPPCIDGPVAMNISFAAGDTVELACTVRLLGDREVSCKLNVSIYTLMLITLIHNGLDTDRIHSVSHG
jgi:hypothetical protein